MSISFSTIPATIRTGGQFIEFNNSMASSGLLAQMPNVNLLIGLARSGAATGTQANNSLVAINSEADAQAKFGHGSILAGMAKAFFDMPGAANLPVYAIGLAPDASGTAASGSFVFAAAGSSGATTAGNAQVYVAGQQVSTPVALGATAGAIAVAVAAGINALALGSNLPVSAGATASTGTVIVSALEKDVTGNAIDLRCNYQQGDAFPGAVTCTVTAMTGGLGTVSLTSAIAAIGPTWFTTIVTDRKDSTNIAALEAAMLANWGPTVMMDGQVYYGGVGNKTAQEADVNGRNSPFSTYMGGGLSPTPPWVFAAQAAAADAGTPDPGIPRTQILLTDCKPPAPGLAFVWADRNTMLGEGISTYTVVNGACYVERLVTTYQKAASGAADPSYMSVETMRTLAYMRYTWRAQVALKFAQFKLAADGTNFDPAQKIVTPKRLTSEAIAWFQSMIDAGLAYNKAQFVASIAGQVQLNPSDPTRVDMILTPQLIRQFRTLAAQIAFIL